MPCLASRLNNLKKCNKITDAGLRISSITYLLSNSLLTCGNATKSQISVGLRGLGHLPSLITALASQIPRLLKEIVSFITHRLQILNSFVIR